MGLRTWLSKLTRPAPKRRPPPPDKVTVHLAVTLDKETRKAIGRRVGSSGRGGMATGSQCWRWLGQEMDRVVGAVKRESER